MFLGINIMKYLIIYLAVINVFAFVLYGVDKRKAVRKKWRIPESALILSAFLGGGLGALLGMFVWHHKTKKWKFRILVPLSIVIWIGVGIFIALRHPGTGEQAAADVGKEAAFSDVPESVSSDISEESIDDPASDEYPMITEEEITLAFAGDINFDDTWSVMQAYYEKGEKLSNVIDEGYLTLMNEADVFWVNNEFTYSNRGEPLDGKMYTFRSKPENVKLLEEMGADIVGLANNHVYDYGKDAFVDTLQTLSDAGILYVGAGYNIDEAAAPVYIEKEGITIAYVAASRAEKYKMTPQATEDEPGILRCYDNTIFIESIREADENADYVIALPHWGTEYSTELEEAQTEGARAYIDAGADIVIGAHTHCLQAIESYKDKPIVYSLGNFWFNEKTLETMLYEVKLTVEKETDEAGEVSSKIIEVSTEIYPGMQEGCVTRLLEGDDAE